MKSRSEFLRVRNEGRTFSGKYLVLGILADQEIIPKMKFGIMLHHLLNLLNFLVTLKMNQKVMLLV